MTEKTIAHYKILEKIGQGGMGIVYKASDTKLERLVALKFLPKELPHIPLAKERFIQEARAAAALDHPNICTVYEINETDDGQTYISMAYIEGQSLREKIRSGIMPIEEALDIAVQIAEGLQEAHAKGILHRDIKPGNIMLTEKGQAKITDFGLAKLEWGTDLTKTASVMGTVAYMSPEQAKGEKVDQRTDIWSLGVVLYEMLTGTLPFLRERDQSTLYAILHEDLKPLRSLRKELPDTWEKVIRKALAKNPDRRYLDVWEFLTDLIPLKKDPDAKAKGVRHAESKPSIAVLPFVDMSPQKDQEYFCDGIAEELINSLSHIGDLHIVARTSAFAFKGAKLDVREIGQKLDVKTVLEGSIRKAGNRVRITAQLINVKDGYHLWSEKFDREMNDIFAIQDEISMAIVDNLKVKLLAREKAVIEKRHTDDPDAYNLYLKGLYFGSKPSPENLEKALEYFKKAIDKDPGFALAFAGMAYVYGAYAIFSFLPPDEILPNAKASLSKALELDEDLPEAHAVSALIAFWFEWDWEAAENHFTKALNLNPGNAFCRVWHGWYQLAMGKPDEAVAEIKRAQALDPLMPFFYAAGTGIHFSADRLDEAVEQFHKAVELDPYLGAAYFQVGRIYVKKGMLDEAFSSFQKSLELVVFAGWAESGIALIHILRGERNKAEQILHDLLERKKTMHVSSYCIASIYFHLGEIDKTLEFLEKAYQERDILMPFIKVFTESIDIRSDPRFLPLVKKMGFEE
jgi:serine/threonine protein kinase/Tfp pilus assembly protein PilF